MILNLERTKKWAFFGVTALVFCFGVTADAQPTDIVNAITDTIPILSQWVDLKQSQLAAKGASAFKADIKRRKMFVAKACPASATKTEISTSTVEMIDLNETRTDFFAFCYSPPCYPIFDPEEPAGKKPNTGVNENKVVLGIGFAFYDCESMSVYTLGIVNFFEGLFINTGAKTKFTIEKGLIVKGTSTNDDIFFDPDGVESPAILFIAKIDLSPENEYTLFNSGVSMSAEMGTIQLSETGGKPKKGKTLKTGSICITTTCSA